MTTSNSSILRLYEDQRPGSLSDEDLTLWDDLSRAFDQLTGQSLDDLARRRRAASRDSVASEVGLALESPNESAQVVRDWAAMSAEPSHANAAIDLANSIERMWDELLRTRDALWRREAELAAGVPVVEDRGESKHLAERIESVLKGGCQAVGCTAAALYTLDEGTTSLQLRGVWNLPHSRFTQSPRPLREANADLESLCGHAVVLADTRQFLHWNPPEAFSAAVCVPVSSNTTPLGTLWFFGDHPRAFTDDDVNIIEIVAGRLAADLEREMLLVAATDGARIAREIDSAHRLQQNQLPRVQPLIDGWQVAGWTAQAKKVGGDFHDWLVLPDERFLLTVADCLDGGFDAALCASALHASLCAFAQSSPLPPQMLNRLSEALWTGSTGDLYAHMFYGLVEPSSGRLVYSTAGSTGALLLAEADWESLSKPSLALGINPDLPYESNERFLRPGNALVVVSDGVIESPDVRGRPLGLPALAQSLAGMTQLTAEQLVERVRKHLESNSPAAARDDRTVLVVKRRR